MHKELIKDIACKTGRLTIALCEEATRCALKDKSKTQCNNFAKNLYDAFKHCKNKSRQLTSGKKLDDSIVEVCTHMRRLSKERLESTPATAVVSMASSPKPKTLVCVSSDETAQQIPRMPGASKKDNAGTDAVQEIWNLYIPNAASSSATEKSPAPTPTQAECPAPTPIEVVDGSADDVSTMWPDKSTMRMEVTLRSGATFSTPLEKGPSGWCIATVQGRTVPTEIPNLMLEPVPHIPKRPRAMCKKPASEKRADIAEADAEETATQPDKSTPCTGEPTVECAIEPTLVPYSAPMQYRVEDYPKKSLYGVREKLGSKKQVFSFRYKSRERGQQLVKECIDKLHNGESVESVKAWAKSQIV